MIKNWILFFALVFCCGICLGGDNSFSLMPVEEVTVFKDGHAFVLHEGQMASDNNGEITVDYLPRPVIGTFWAYSADKKAKLKSVVTGRKVVEINKTAMSIPELIEANVGKRVQITEGNTKYEAKIIEVLKQTRQELNRTSPAGTSESLGITSNIVLLQTAGTTKAVQINQITEITFLDDPKSSIDKEEFRDTMKLKFEASKNNMPEKLKVGMVYLQRGIRWIPSYRIEIDGEGNAVFKLQATLVNELIDLKGVKAHLVIGVPSFAFKDTVDPISLQQTVAQLGGQFRENAQTAYAFSNAIMSQSVMYTEPQRGHSGGSPDDTLDIGPSISESKKNEDLYVFTLENVTLKKGERMVVPVTEFKVSYRDVYKVNIPFAPPWEIRRNYNNNRQMEMAKLLAENKAKHFLRVKNTSDYPLTTAPATIFKDGRILAQAMTRYTAVSGTSDVELTVAVDIKVKKKDVEVKRTPNAENWHGITFDRVDMEGGVKITNFLTKPIDLEVVRMTMGKINSAGNDGEIEQKDIYDIDDFQAGSLPEWWNWYSWPWWWYHHNPMGRVEWKFSLKPGEEIELDYKWHYLWD